MTRLEPRPVTGHGGDVEHVVLLDPTGRPAGVAPKRAVHHDRTPFHLAFSCHVVDPDGRVLIARRSASKPTWPSTWSNACCGHPQPGESLRQAVERRLEDELGLRPTAMTVAVPDFAYRAVMANGVVEHELCPVVVAGVERDAPIRLDPAEADDARWVSWDELRARARDRPSSLSPWSVAQAARLDALAVSPLALLRARPRADAALDRPIVVGSGRAGHRPGVDGRDPTAAVRDRVGAVLDRFLAERERELATLDPSLAELTGEIRSLVEAGGKRLRPAFVYWGYRAGGAGDDDAVIAAAAAVEMLHTFALVHDDVMDRSATRRGRPSAPAAHAARHRAAGLRGDDARFGDAAAILTGDLAFVWADMLLDAAPLPPAELARARGVFARLRSEVVAGQYLDLRAAGMHAVDEDAARRVALLKTARYTVTRPLELGAALVPGGGLLPAPLAAYGDALGVAFQLRDDVLGLFGEPAVTGKGRDDDLREGKRTLLVLAALRRARPADRRLLLGALGSPDLSPAEADRCRQVVERCGALDAVEAEIAQLHELARAAAATVGGRAGEALARLADTCARRDR